MLLYALPHLFSYARTHDTRYAMQLLPTSLFKTKKSTQKKKSTHQSSLRRLTMRWPGRVPPYWMGIVVVIVLITVGFAGVFLPLLPGLLLIGLGLLLLLEYHHIPFLERKREWFAQQYQQWKENINKKKENKQKKK